MKKWSYMAGGLSVEGHMRILCQNQAKNVFSTVFLVTHCLIFLQLSDTRKTIGTSKF